MTSYLTRMPSGIPGDVSRKSQSTVEPQLLGGTAFPTYGVFGKLVSGAFVPLDSSDTDDTKIYALLVRSYPTNSAQDPLGTATPPTSGIVDGLRRGYMTVVNCAGTPVKGGKVYVRTSAPATGQPVGGIEASSSTGNVLVTKATFMDAGDASGNVEICFNI